MNKKGGILADVVLILLGFLIGTIFGRFILTWIEKVINTRMPLI
jgi:uncharacterized membrane protein